MVKPKQINLIPKDALKGSLPEHINALWAKHQKGRNFIIIFSGVIIYTIILIGKADILKWRLAESKRQMQQAKVKLNQMQSQSLNLEKQKTELSKEEGLKKQRLELLLSTSSKERKYSRLLTFIATLVPQELWINQFVINEAQIQVSGTTFNPQLIIQFMNQLDNSGSFRNSHFASSEKQVMESHTVHNFQITTEPAWDLLLKNQLGNAKSQGEVKDQGKEYAGG